VIDGRGHGNLLEQAAGHASVIFRSAEALIYPNKTLKKAGEVGVRGVSRNFFARKGRIDLQQRLGLDRPVEV